MSKVTLDYTELGNAQKNAKKSRDELEDYEEGIDRKVISGLNNLTGEDSAGYISTAITLANTKCSEMYGFESAFDSLEGQLRNLNETAKSADRTVKSKINEIADNSLEKQSLWEWAGNCIYNIFCVDLPNALSNLPFFDALIDDIRNMYNFFANFKEKILSWFREGVGVYVKNIIKAAADFLVAATVVVGAVIAVATLPVVGTVLGIVGCVAGGVYLVYKFLNMTAAVNANEEAISYVQKAEETGDQSNLAVAHYYGKTTGVSSWVKKHDLGGIDENVNAEMWAGFGDVVGQRSEVTLKALKFVGTIGNLGALHSPDNKKVIGYDYSKGNIIDNIKRKMWKNLGQSWPEKDGQGRVVSEGKFDFGEFLFSLTEMKKDDAPSNTIKIISGISDFISSDVTQNTEIKGYNDLYSNLKQNWLFKTFVDPVIGPTNEVSVLIEKEYDIETIAVDDKQEFNEAVLDLTREGVEAIKNSCVDYVKRSMRLTTAALGMS